MASRSVNPVGDAGDAVLRGVARSSAAIARCAIAASTRSRPTATRTPARDLLLGRFEDVDGAAFGVVGVVDHLVAGEDQVAQRRLFLDDAGVVLDVGRARHAVHERRDVGRPADFVQVAGPAELLAQGHHVDRSRAARRGRPSP
jgi:hypothetical protein